MAKPGMAIEVVANPSFRDTAGRFTKATDELVNAYRDGFRFQGRRLVKILQDEAPKDTGDFSRGIRFKTFKTSGRKATITLRTTMPQPLGTFITKGTKPHKIQAKSAKALYFYWPKVSAFTVVPKAGGFKTHRRRDGKLWIGKGYVDHPGTKPNDFVGRSYDRWWPSARKYFAKVSVRIMARFAK